MQTNKARIPPQTAALLRCVQKDDEYQRLLLNENNDIFQRLFGIRKWLKFRKEIECLSKFTYFAITTLTGVQTLGEEYVDIVQVHGDKLIVPSFNRRLMMILLQTTTPYIIEKTIAHLIKLVEDPNVRMVPEILNDTEIRLNLIEILPKFKKGECPLCRESVQPFQLVFLQNYD
ncbi:hypothetical protein B4U79_06096 [Dinothrombium tinctorium]|uniref:RING-type E3 ubiquitin transferase n=1 Tax=Dinothrombium tinctorium TaxID=1965070 RepID=A0A443RR97_9ACAR|nr:hypothetical protein B4U79_06096 [Dinothrombium tinctorium]